MSVSQRPVWIEIRGRKRRFATVADAQRYVSRFVNVIVGIQCDHTPNPGPCLGCGISR